MLEIAVGVFAGWLWQKVADTAKSKDDETAIKKALDEATRNGFNRFVEKHSELAASLFDQYFLENYAGPELAKYLTRNKVPDVAVVAAVYRTQFGQSCPAGIEEAISDLLNFVMEAMKEQTALQSIINQRQIEETNRIIKEVGAEASHAVDLLEHQSQIYIEDQRRQSQFQVDSLQVQAKILSILENNSAPQSSGNEVNKLLAKQLDMVRDKIRNSLFVEAREILNSHRDEIAASDSFTKFRWHTNMATCMLVDGKEEDAANEYLIAFDYAPEEEKAIANRARAFLLKHQFENGLAACEAGIAKFPTSSILWSLRMNARLLLGNEEPDAELPESLHDEEDVLYTLSFIKQKQGRQQESYELAYRCYEKNKKSPEAKRALLSSAITWATVDPVTAHFGQFSAAQMQALQSAINAYEPIENSLETIQPEMVSFEVTNNLAIALRLKGDEEHCSRIVLRGLQRYPLAEGLLQIRINELGNTNDIPAIHNLTDGLVNELPTGALIALAETYANCGEINWYEKALSVLDKREVDEQIASELSALLIHALWKSGSHIEAIEKAKSNLSTNPTNILLRIIFANILRRQGHALESEKQARQCLAAVNETTPSQTVLQIADLLYDFSLFLEASDLYGRLSAKHGWGQLTQRYLICLVESDQRERARQILEVLPKSVRELSTFRRIEINLAWATGNLPRLRDLLKLELDLKPSDSGIAVGYVGALHRLVEIEKLKAFLATDPVFENGKPENEFEFVKYQVSYGFALQAIRRVYRLFRAHPQDARIAGFYLLALLMSEDMKFLPVVDNVIPGSAVQLSYQNDTRWVAIEESGLPLLETWPEVVRSDSVQANLIVGKKLGDKTLIDSGFGKLEAEIVQIENILLFASRKAHEVIAASTAPSGPLWSVNLGKPNGELDIEPILESLRKRSKYVEGIFAQYLKQPFPISALAGALGSDPVTLLLEWPYKHARFFVSVGTQIERDHARELLNNDELRYVLDLVTLAELARCNILEQATKVLGTPLLPQTLKDQLLGLIQFVDSPKASSNMREENGQFYITDIPVGYYVQRKQFLQKLLSYINKHCEVVPTFGPAIITQNHRLLAQLTDNASIDSIYLALERKAILISEDGALRYLAAQVGVANTLGLQPLLMHLRDANHLKQSEYSRIIIEKLSLGQDFVSVASDDLIWAAKKSKGHLSLQVKAVLETFKRPSLDIQSGIIVCAGLLRAVTEVFHPSLVKAYFEECRDALSFGRNDAADSIATILRLEILRVLTSEKRTKSITEPQQDLMHQLVNEEVTKLFRPKKIVQTIQNLFNNS